MSSQSKTQLDTELRLSVKPPAKTKKTGVVLSSESLVPYLRDLCEMLVSIDKPVLMGNICQVRPPANRIESFSWVGDEITHGLSELAKGPSTFPTEYLCTTWKHPAPCSMW